mmetsp:Transcript_17056/g.25822  ORF Transcript_17056/g.25822 Transcript_17056/m.25822 type:complete len:154 (+) Transcript_17056:159-620(+)|eukprot:CAMPEP_0178918056 /NCGR_PEP_ID=MMETSP0786-20121207/13610_1 /TAXON_ID=186022 /ORGANISM="Thalassionema frauenfeldii, Strain CCMP 1798" /LENGTH=153 /DNA_ID=CAMNT_0020591715 /DNA_START=114 /DNA_END=575 /DNA_ORIENTATION=-
MRFQKKMEQQFTPGTEAKSYEETMKELDGIQIEDDASLDSMEDVEFGDEPDASNQHSEVPKTQKNNQPRKSFALLAVAATVATGATAGVVVFSEENTNKQPLVRGSSPHPVQVDDLLTLSPVAENTLDSDSEVFVMEFTDPPVTSSPVSETAV